MEDKQKTHLEHNIKQEPLNTQLASLPDIKLPPLLLHGGREQYLWQSHMIMVLLFTSLLTLIKHQLLYQDGPKPYISRIPGKLVIPFADRTKSASLRGYQVWFARLQSHSVLAPLSGVSVCQKGVSFIKV